MTIFEAINGMQEPYKSKALVNMRSWHRNTEVDNLSNALRCAFDWTASPEGIQYWNDYYYTLKQLDL